MGQTRVFDIATLIGVAGAFVLVLTAIVLGGTPLAFLDVPSVLIVIGGTLLLTTACFTLGEMMQSVTIVMRTISYSAQDPSDAAMRTLQLAEVARRNGVLGLQGEPIESTGDQPFLQKGLNMAVDGAEPFDLERDMKKELAALATRHAQAAGILRKAGEISPAMGLIGTLIGLVQMLGNLDDPSTIGPAMAVALLTTFYGAILANMVFNPLASKLERNSQQEQLVNQIYVTAVTSIASGENPRRLEMLLNGILPPSKRVQYFD